MKVNSTAFQGEIDNNAFRNISYGVYLVTSHLGDKLNGQIANSVFQVCAEPPGLAVSINKENLTHEYIKESGVWAVSVLDQKAPFKFIGLFGFKSGKDVDKFSGLEYNIGATGSPLITENVLSIIEVKMISSMDVATHTLFVGNPVNARLIRDGTPLTYKYYHEVIKGKTPKKATTYIR